MFQKKLLVVLLSTIAFSTTAFAGTQHGKSTGSEPKQSAVCTSCDDDPGDGGDGGAAENSIVHSSIDAQTNHEFSLLMSDGTNFVINNDLNKMFVTNDAGTVAFNLDTVLLAWAQNDVAKANALRAKLRSTLTNSSNQMELTRLGAANSFMKGKPPKSVGQGLRMDGSGGSYWKCYYDWWCNYQPVNDFMGGGWGGYGFGFLSAGGGGSSGTPDWFYWNRWRLDRCDDASINVRNMVILGAGAAAACPASVTLLPALGCAAAGAGFFSELDQWADNSVACKATYPGPGNW